MARKRTTSEIKPSDLRTGIPSGKPMQRHGALYDPAFPPEFEPWDHSKEEIICDSIRRGANLAAACRLAFPFHSNNAYMRVRSRFKIDSEFKAAVEQAQQEYDSLLTSEATRRAVEGILKPVFFQGVRQYEDVNGKMVPVTVREFSDKLLEVLIKQRMPGPAKQVSVTGKIRHSHEHTNGDDRDSGCMTIRPADLLRLPDDERQYLINILRGIAERRGETDLEALDELREMPPLLESRAIEIIQPTDDLESVWASGEVP